MSTERPDLPPPTDDLTIHVEVPLGIGLSGPDPQVDAQTLMALGALVRESAQLDQALRTLYCALVGSAYAAVTVAGATTSWMLDTSLATAKARTDLEESHLADLTALLSRASSANGIRNRVVHDVWAVSDRGPLLVRSKRGTHDLSVEPINLDSLIRTAQELTSCSVLLSQWIEVALGPAALDHEARLRWLDFLATLTPTEVEEMVERRRDRRTQGRIANRAPLPGRAPVEDRCPPEQGGSFGRLAPIAAVRTPHP